MSAKQEKKVSDKVLIDALVVQANESNKVDKGFKETTCVYVAGEIDVILQEHPKTSGIRDNPKKCTMCTVLGNDNAMGQWEIGPKYMLAKKSSNVEKGESISVVEVQEVGNYFEGEKSLVSSIINASQKT